MRQKWNNVQRRESEAGASVEGLKNCSQCWDHGPSARGVGPGSRVGQSVAICQMRCCFIQGSEDKLVLSSAGFKALGGGVFSRNGSGLTDARTAVSTGGQLNDAG